jgi:hypothetical protein
VPWRPAHLIAKKFLQIVYNRRTGRKPGRSMMTDEPEGEVQKLILQLMPIFINERHPAIQGSALAGMLAFWLLEMPEGKREQALTEHVAQTRRMMTYMLEDRRQILEERKKRLT